MAFPKTLILCLAVVLLPLIISFCEAREFEVGGKKNSWVVPNSPDQFNKWAARNRFQIGDSIVLKYDAKTDSVLEVSEDVYKTCNKSSPIKSYNDGSTKIIFERSGPFFFISGAQGHCEEGQKLEIKVLSAKHGVHAPSPAQINHHILAPVPAPANGGAGLRAGFTAALTVVGFYVFV